MDGWILLVVDFFIYLNGWYRPTVWTQNTSTHEKMLVRSRRTCTVVEIWNLRRIRPKIPESWFVFFLENSHFTLCSLRNSVQKGFCCGWMWCEMWGTLWHWDTPLITTLLIVLSASRKGYLYLKSYPYSFPFYLLCVSILQSVWNIIFR